MAGDFAASSHLELWIKHREDVEQAHARMVDLVLPNTEAVQVFYDYFIEAIQHLMGKTTEQGSKYRQQIAATAIVYFRRAYFLTSPADLHPCIAAAACVLLACKTEELGSVDIRKLARDSFDCAQRRLCVCVCVNVCMC